MPQAALVLGTFIFETIGITASAWVAELVGSIIIATVAYAIGTALLPNLSFNPDSQKQNIRQAVSPRRRYYGTVKCGGVYAFLAVRSRPNFNVGGASNHLFALLLIAAHEIDSILEHWLGDKLVTLNGSDLVNEDPFYTVGVRRAKLVAQLGTDSQTAHSELTTYFPGEWTSAHRVRGTANLLGVFKGVEEHNFTKVFPQGVPTMRVVMQSSKVAGIGDDLDDPTTWTFTENAARIIMNYLWADDGLRLPRSLIELAIDEWATAIDACDEQVSLVAGGTENRFRLSGGYEITNHPRDVLPLMLEPVGGMNMLRMRGDGAVVLDLPKYCEPQITISDQHILSFSDMRRQPEVTDLRNEIRARYVDPDSGYEEQEAEPWRNEASISVDGLRSHTMNLTWCPSHAQARRRMKLESYRLNPDWIGTITTNGYGLNALGEQLIRVQIEDLAIDEVFEIMSFKIDSLRGRCIIGIRSMPSEAFDWVPASEEGTPPSGAEASEELDTYVSG